MTARARPHDQRGQILIFTAFALTGLLGIAALSIDAAYLYDKRNRLYAAADNAAKSAATEMRRQRNPTNEITQAAMEAFADQAVAAHGFTPVRMGGNTSVTVRKCDNVAATCTAPRFNNNNYVEVFVSEPTSTFFGRIFGWMTGTPRVRAVAGSVGNPHCLVILDHAYFTVPDNTSFVDINNCSMVINGELANPELSNNTDIRVNGANDIGVFHTPGCVSPLSGGSQCNNVTPGVPRALDPLKSLTPLQDPSPGALCLNPFGVPGTKVVIDQPRTLNPGKYCQWLFSGPNGRLTLNPGNYYLTGDPTVPTPTPGIDVFNHGSNVWIQANGVMIYLTANAYVNMDANNVDLDMSASSVSGNPYNGILFYQNRNTPRHDAVFGFNTTNLKFDGAMYFPSQTVKMKNENSALTTNPCSVIVAWAIEIEKPKLYLNNTCFDFAGSPVMSVSLAE